MGCGSSKNTSHTCQAKILMVGLDSSGKTSMLYKWRLNEVVKTIPAIGFNVESVKAGQGSNYTVWDVGGQDKIRPLWRHYYKGTQGLVYVVNCNDRERLGQAKQELLSVLDSPEMAGVPLLLLANKQDLPGSLTVDGLTEQMSLDDIADREWKVVGTSIPGYTDNTTEALNTLQTFKRLH